MIFYTLKGPSSFLEIHDDKILLIKTGWRTLFWKKNAQKEWPLAALSRFEITVPQFIIHGKIEWETFDGQRGSFRFSTDARMVKMIEKYMQKRVIKNYQKMVALPEKAPAPLHPPAALAA